jgi:hypothetical protein
MFGLTRLRRHHHEPEREPDAWTEERRNRAVELARRGGNVEQARAWWMGKARLGFATWLVDHGRVGEFTDE